MIVHNMGSEMTLEEALKIFNSLEFGEPERPTHDYVVTATVSIVVRATDPWDARLKVQEGVTWEAVLSDYADDPANSLTVTGVEQVYEGE